LSAPQPQIPSQAYTAPQYQQQYSGATPTTGNVRGTTDGGYTWHRQERLIPENAFDKDSGIEFKGILMPYKSEFLHLLIGAFLIFVIGLIGFWSPQLIQMNLMWAIFMLAGFYMTAFLFHEFGHRQVAKHFGLQTKFRLLVFGMVITFFSLIMGLTFLIAGATPLPAFALPGAVVVLGLDKIDRKTGWCKAAGPIVNLVYGTVLILISLFIPIYPLNLFIGYAGFLNFSLGLFNMIPLGILDGQNIFKWNKGIYFFLAGSLLVLLIITWILITEQSFYLT
jgi:Zn-dependent protease